MVLIGIHQRLVYSAITQAQIYSDFSADVGEMSDSAGGRLKLQVLVES